MEGEVGAQIAPPFCPHQPLPGRFHGVPMARKRDLPWQNPSFPYNQHCEQSQQLPAGSGFQGPSPGGNWDAKMWGWDSVRFSAKPSDALSLGTQVTSGIAAEVEQRQAGEEVSRGLVSSKGFEEDGENLALKLGGGSYTAEAPVVRPNKRVRSGSPGSGSGNYPMCQVDDCKADLSSAKDYHRRHKVCEVHSKTTKALVGKQMQRFCQQCSR